MRKTFGKLATGDEARLYTISCGRIQAKITNYGASLVALFVDGLDVVLGCDDVSGYERNGAYLGAVVGRNAHRVGGAGILSTTRTVWLQEIPDYCVGSGRFPLLFARFHCIIILSTRSAFFGFERSL